MPGANYRNSSSGRNEHHDKNDERDSAGPKKPLPANIRVAHRAEVSEVPASAYDDAQSSPQFAHGNTLTMTPPRNVVPKLKTDKQTTDTKPQRSESASNTKIFAKATKSAEKLTVEATSDKKENASRPRAQRQAVSKNVEIEGSRCWQVRLTPSTLLTISILLLVTLGFFFLFGLIVGRGSVPPAQAPVLERLTPQASTAAESPEQILSEENLRFMTNLKNDAPAPVEIGNVTQAVAPKSTTDRKTEAAKDTPKEAPTEAKADNTKYDFVVRAAAFKSENQADDLRARLEGNGIRTRLVREKAQKGTWYHVQILYRGTDQGLEDLRNSLKKYAIKDTILASRTVVE